MFNVSVASAVNRSNSSLEDYYYYDAYDYDYVIPAEPCSFNMVAPEVGISLNTIICILGLAGNCLVIIAYALQKLKVDMFMLNIVMADLLFAAALPVIIVNEAWDWPMGPLACKLLRGVYSVNLYSGMLLLACISADHYITFVQGRLSSPPYKWVTCCVVWLLAFGLSFPIFYYYDTYQPDQLTTADYDGYEDYDVTTVAINTTVMSAPANINAWYVCALRVPNNTPARQMVVLVRSVPMVLGLFFPLLIVVICYSKVTFTLLRNKRERRRELRCKEVWVLLAVVAVFVACHFPYNIALMVDALTMFSLQSCEFAQSMETAEAVTKTMAYLHCCLNPMLLYPLFRVKSRETGCGPKETNVML